MRHFAMFLAGFLLLLGHGWVQAQQDAADIVRGVDLIAAPGSPGSLSVVGSDARVLVAGRSGQHLEPAAAAVTMGQGRVVALGHDGYFAINVLNEADTGRFFTQATRWAAQAQPTDDVRVGLYQQNAIEPFFQQQGFATVRINQLDADQLRQQVDVLVLRPSQLGNPQQLEAVRSFIQRGGGVIAAGTGWGWQQLNASQTLATDYPGNKLLAPVGIYWTNNIIRATRRGGFDTRQLPDTSVHAQQAWQALVDQAAGDRRMNNSEVAQAGASVTNALALLAEDDAFLLPQLRRAITADQAIRYPTAENRVQLTDGMQRVLIAYEHRQLMATSPEDIEAHPAAADFPGDVPAEAPRVSREISIDTARPDWHSTGLYAPPGQLINVSLSPQAIEAGLTLRIGSHRHTHWHMDRWSRYPEILRVAPLDQPTVAAANPFGGLIYVDVPANRRVGTVTLTITDAVEAPFYVHGQTDVEQWRQTIRNHPAPWGELATDKVIITLPSHVLRDLDDPKALMDFWDQVMDACADLAAIDRTRTRPERFVSDVQLVAGYMHAGYPIMCHLDAPPRFVDLNFLSTRGDWGMFHEIGHNHQNMDWTFEGTIEVTVNLFTVYVMETVVDNHDSRRDIHPQVILRSWREYVRNGRDFEQWKRDPFLALGMYMQMQRAFGWEAYKTVFAEYLELPRNQRPRNDAEKRDQWLVRFSREVGHNLGPFFEAWGVPTSQAARDEIKDLPVWMPEGMDQQQ